MTIATMVVSYLPVCLIAISISSFIVGGSMAAAPFWSPRTTTTTTTTTTVFGKRISDMHSLDFLQHRSKNMVLTSLRGGSTTVEGIGEEEDDEDDDDEGEGELDSNNDKDEESTTATTTSENNPPSIASMGPVQLFISTNWGNSVIDHSVDLKSKRTKTIADLKKSLSKQLPGRPPILSMGLVYEGRLLDDETLVEELFEDEDDEDDDDDDDDDDDETNEPNRKLTLNIVPPVDPKFMTELGPKLMFYSDDVDDGNNFMTNSAAADADSLSTTELVDAYYLNQVAMSRNAHLLADPNTPLSPYTRLELVAQAKELRDQLNAQTPTDLWEKLMEVRTQKSLNDNKDEWRGERYRSGKGGVTTQFRTTLQTNLNVNWNDAIKNFMVCLFFGYFGGKNSGSLMWFAPLSFALQARPVKMWFKVIFYMLSNPPSILLSFLPAPQQAILSVNFRNSCVALYGEDGANSILKNLGLVEKSTKRTTSTITEEEEESSDEETDVDSDDDITDVEDEYDDEDDYDEDE